MKKIWCLLLIFIFAMSFVIAETSDTTTVSSDTSTTDSATVASGEVSTDTVAATTDDTTTDADTISQNVASGIREAYRDVAAANKQVRATIKEKLKEGDELTIGEKRLVVMAMNNKIQQLKVRNFVANTELEIEQVSEDGETKLSVNMPNGIAREIKVMPDTAAARAIERLRIRNCNESNNCTIELKDVGKRNAERLAYAVRARKQARLFGVIPMRMNQEVEIDAETGEVINTKKPWWAFLASERDEEPEVEEAQCAGQGEGYYDGSDIPGCCEGLKDVRGIGYIAIEGECYWANLEKSDYHVCSNCGNGICEDVETLCGCFEDCEGERESISVEDFCKELYADDCVRPRNMPSSYSGEIFLDHCDVCEETSESDM